MGDTTIEIVVIAMQNQEREITMRCIFRRFRTWLLITSLLTLSSLMILQSMLYRITQSNRGYYEDAKFQKRFLGSYSNSAEVRILRLGSTVGDKLTIIRDKSGLPMENYNEMETENGDKNDDDDDNEDDDDDDDEDDDEEYTDRSYKNPVFNEGDFGSIKHTKPQFQYQEIQRLITEKFVFIPKTRTYKNSEISLNYQTSQNHAQHSSSNHRKTTKLKHTSQKLSSHKHTSLENNLLFTPRENIVGRYTDGVYWMEKVEQLVPKGPSLEEVTSQIMTTQTQNVTQLQAATWNRCGRAKNGFAMMSDGSGFCARYRAPHQNLILGEVLSYYLSLLLGMDNVPIVILSQIQPHSGQWSRVNYGHLNWTDGQIVALIQWRQGLNSPRSKVTMPQLLLNAVLSNTTLHPISLANQNLSTSQLTELVQWGEMIIFDYITGNYDRVASMQDGANHQNQPSVLSEPIRNLRKHNKTSKFCLIDNESGLLDAYDLLYKSRNGHTFATFHRQMLKSICIFKKSMIDRLEQLLRHSEPHRVLMSYTEKYQPLLQRLEKNWLFDVFKVNFPERLKEVYTWVQQCKTAFR